MIFNVVPGNCANSGGGWSITFHQGKVAAL